jgi:hypothetical protein
MQSFHEARNEIADGNAGGAAGGGSDRHHREVLEGRDQGRAHNTLAHRLEYGVAVLANVAEAREQNRVGSHPSVPVDG